MSSAKGKKREDFIAAVVQVIAKQGIDGATTREIAKEAGTSLASLHYCFDSKEALLLASYEHLMNTLREVTLHVRPGAGLGRTAATLVRQMMDWYKTEPGYARTQMEIESWVLRHYPDVCRQNGRRWIDSMEAQMRVGMRADDDDDLVPSLARLATATIDGMVAHSFAYEQRAEYLQTTMDAAAEALESLAARHVITPSFATSFETAMLPSELQPLSHTLSKSHRTKA